MSYVGRDKVCNGVHVWAGRGLSLGEETTLSTSNNFPQTKQCSNMTNSKHPLTQRMTEVSVSAQTNCPSAAPS